MGTFLQSLRYACAPPCTHLNALTFGMAGACHCVLSICNPFFVCSDFADVWNKLGFTEKKGYPVIVFDEANSLYSWQDKFSDSLKVSGCKKNPA
jgi:hypothetical protein